MVRFIEFGHYYQDKGPTILSAVGQMVFEKIRKPDDKSILFIDDVHSLSELNTEERALPNVEMAFDVDHTFYESNMRQKAFEALELLKTVPSKRKKARFSNGVWYCSGKALTKPSGEPTCILLDVGLTLLKKGLGLPDTDSPELINVLPHFYDEQQKSMLRLVEKIDKEVKLRVVLFNLEGEHWNMD